MVEEEQRAWRHGVMVIYSVPVGYTGYEGSIDNARRPGRRSMIRPTINEESDCLRKKKFATATAPISYMFFYCKSIKFDSIF